MEILDAEIEKYIEQHTSEEKEALKQLNRETYLNVLMPHMLSGHVQGVFLSLFSKAVQPKTILEIGTFTGYSAIALAEGLTQDGVLHTIDINEELAEMVAAYIEKAGLKNKIKQHIGNALDIIPTLDLQFDLVFIDADKKNYFNYYTLVKDKVAKGGIILADNVLWKGKVVETASKTDKDTKVLMEFNKAVAEDPEVEQTILPIRDGLMLIRKL